MANGIGYSGTFLMCLFAAHLATCGDFFRNRDIKDSLTEARREVKYVREDLERLSRDHNHALIYGNVLGGPELESFYTIDGKRVYVTVDGKAVEEYFPLQAENGTR